MFDKIALDENPLAPDLSSRNNSKPRLPRQFLRRDTTKVSRDFQSENHYRRLLGGTAHSQVPYIEWTEKTSSDKATLSFGIGASICASGLGIRVEDIMIGSFLRIGRQQCKGIEKIKKRSTA